MLIMQTVSKMPDNAVSQLHIQIFECWRQFYIQREDFTIFYKITNFPANTPSIFEPGIYLSNNPILPCNIFIKRHLIFVFFSDIIRRRRHNKVKYRFFRE